MSKNVLPALFHHKDPDKPCGWIPYSRRGRYQKLFSDIFLSAKGRFRDRAMGYVDLPDRVILADLERKATGGKLLPRPWQVTGSCVGVGGMRAYTQSICGDIVLRGDVEAPKFPFPFATYGVGREIAGMRRVGEGSFGAAQAQAVQPNSFGMLSWDDERVPAPTFIDDGNHAPWVKWKKEEEIAWSHPIGWPVGFHELKKDAVKYGVHDVASIKTIEELLQSLAQGYGVTIASMFGTQPRVEKDVLLGRYNSSWAHQMTYGGYWRHPDFGLILLQDNQWGPSIHGNCPTLEPMGIRGSYWQLASDTEKLLNSRDGECFSHTNTGGFPTQRFDWGDMGWSYQTAA